MSAIWRHVWQIDSSLLNTNLSDHDIMQLFKQLRGQDLNKNIEQSILEQVYLGQTDHDSYRIDIDRTIGRMSIIRQFQDLTSAQVHYDLYMKIHPDVFPAQGTPQFQLITREVLDNMTLDQVTN